MDGGVGWGLGSCCWDWRLALFCGLRQWFLSLMARKTEARRAWRKMALYARLATEVEWQDKGIGGMLKERFGLIPKPTDPFHLFFLLKDIQAAAPSYKRPLIQIGPRLSTPLGSRVRRSVWLSMRCIVTRKTRCFSRIPMPVG